MFDKVRKPTRAKMTYQFIGYGLLGIICLSFAFVGMFPSGQGGTFSGGGAAAVVNNEVIPIGEFQQAVQRVEKQYGDAWDKMPAAQRQMYKRAVRERTLNELVGTEVLYQSTENNGFYTPKSAVINEVVSLPYFQEDGHFSKERYRAILQANRLNPASFEANIRKEVALGQVRDAFFRSLKKPEVLRSLDEKARQTRLELEFVHFSHDQIDADKLVKSADVDAYLASTDGATRVKSYYDANHPEFEQPAQVKARHILIKSDGSKELDQKAMAKMDEIRRNLTPENFAAQAKKFSEDLGSKDKGGELGYFKKGAMVPEFEEAAFAAKVGTIAGPVKTGFGYHLILVEDKTQPTVTSFEDARKGIAHRLLAEEARDKAIADLEKTLKENPAQLNQKLKELSLSWESTGEFDLSQNLIPKMGEVNQAVSQALALNEPGKVVPSFIRNGGQIFIVKLKSIQAAAKPALIAPGAGDFSSEAMEALNTWATDLKKDARVQVNTDLLLQ